VANKDAPDTMMPERDYWYEYSTDPGTSAAVQMKRVVVHVHYLSTWAEQDESQVTQVNARWPSAAHYQFESHSKIQSGITTNVKMFLVTGVKKTKPTMWMAGGANQPPPWRWLDDPTREDGCVGATIKMPDRPLVVQDLRTVYEDNGVLMRFHQAYRIMKHGYDISCSSQVTSFSFPVDAAVGEYDTALRPDEFAGEDGPASEIRPFKSPKHWAAFIVTGDGSRVEPVGAVAAVAAE